MKKRISILFVIVLMAVTGFAQKVALHSASGVRHFTGADAFRNAYTASVSGDTIYLPGGSFTQTENGYIDKTLTIFGAGHYPDSTAVTGKTFINGFITLRTGADNFYIEGVEITGNFTLTANQSVNNVTVRNCKIDGSFNATGTTNPSMNLCLIGNVFMSNIDIQNVQNALISNNIIIGVISNSTGNLISNNILLSSTTTSLITVGIHNVVSNNIIVKTSISSNGQGNQFLNNLIVAATPNYGTNPITSGNYTGIPQADIFVNQTGFAFNYAHDYHLQNPEIYLGTDGTEVGIYGGIFPYKEGAVPSNPHIQSATIAPTTNEGKLNVKVKARAN
jgi:hypothetical protein